MDIPLGTERSLDERHLAAWPELRHLVALMRARLASTNKQFCLAQIPERKVGNAERVLANGIRSSG